MLAKVIISCFFQTLIIEIYIVQCTCVFVSLFCPLLIRIVITWLNSWFLILSFWLCLFLYISCSCTKSLNYVIICRILMEHNTRSQGLVFSGVRVTLYSLIVCVCFIDRCLSFCPFSFGHCVVCPSSIYGFWLPLGYLRILITPWVFSDSS